MYLATSILYNSKLMFLDDKQMYLVIKFNSVHTIQLYTTHSSIISIMWIGDSYYNR